MASKPFEVICEIEPATRPDLVRVRRQIGVLGTVAGGFLIPDNHIGRATVSSIAVAHEVAQMGGRAIACLNARDRNTLGFRRDLLTASAYGVDEFLFVYGDRPESGRRSDDLTVRTMIDEARSFAEHGTFATAGRQAASFRGEDPARHAGDSRSFGGRIRIGVSTRFAPLPAWKGEADMLFSQVTFSLTDLLAWRSSIDFDGPVYAGVMVVASAQMARKLSSDIAQLAVPTDLIERVERDRDAGVDAACDLVGQIRESGAFDGVHLVPVSRYREVAARLETLLRS